jgi:hypothetical protein
LDSGFLQSLDQGRRPLDAEKSKEFLEAVGGRSAVTIEIKPYDRGTISGNIYRFMYSLRGGVRTAVGGDTLSEGAKITLFVVIKYRIDSLKEHLRGMSYEVPGNPLRKDYGSFEFLEGESLRRYTVFPVTYRGRRFARRIG